MHALWSLVYSVRITGLTLRVETRLKRKATSGKYSHAWIGLLVSVLRKLKAKTHYCVFECCGNKKITKYLFHSNDSLYGSEFVHNYTLCRMKSCSII